MANWTDKSGGRRNGPGETQVQNNERAVICHGGSAREDGNRLVIVLCAWLFAAITPALAAVDPQAVLQASCAACHAADSEGNLSRIGEQRKTPEGWQMTLVRMQAVHKVQIVDPAGGDSATATRALVKYLADTQGLAPAESAPYRYILEQELNTVEDNPSPQFAAMCARCHTGARVGLQRRSEDEWRHLVHFHLGQFPTTEYQMMGRDRDWRGQAFNDMVPYLAKNFPLNSSAWEQWQEREARDFSGAWRVIGRMPGQGAFSGLMTAEATSGDRYRLAFEGSFSDGEALSGKGTAIVYTGYDWRASLTLGDRKFRQVLAADAAGTAMIGRMFDRDHSEWGLHMQAVRNDDQPRLLAVQPAAIAAGGEAELRLVGTALAGEIELGAGLRVTEVVSRDAGEIVLRVIAAADVAEGTRAVTIGALVVDGALTVYREIDRVMVEPAYAIARVGGDGGSQPVVEAMFDAVAYTRGADGEAGTDDDLRIGPVAARWSVQPFDAQAERDQDVRFAGTMDRDRGVFTPAGAGPNPERRYQTNNAGNLRVVATVGEGEAALTGDGQLIVTVQRWNNPPIR
jgi:quinohemoprotein amine dehydrogenase